MTLRKAARFSAPLGSVQIGIYSTSGYGLFLIGATVVLLAAVWVVLRFTPVGLIARGTMQNPGMAAALGVPTERVYALSFAAGAAVSGLAGALAAEPYRLRRLPLFAQRGAWRVEPVASGQR